MTERVTKDDLKKMAERVNWNLKGSGNKVIVAGRCHI
jgi:hypothetical protein